MIVRAARVDHENVKRPLPAHVPAFGGQVLRAVPGQPTFRKQGKLLMKQEIRKRGREALDARLSDASLRPEDRFRAPPKGWIRALRDVLGMSTAQLGKRIGGKRRQSIEDWERAEADGTIQLKTLRQAAEALECNLIYALVPKTSLAQTVDSQARKIALRDLKRVAHTMELEAQGTDRTDWETRVEEYIRKKLKNRDIWNEP